MKYYEISMKGYTYEDIQGSITCKGTLTWIFFSKNLLFLLETAFPVIYLGLSLSCYKL